jgi:NTE family protein
MAKTALVVSGGGAKGAFAVGAIKEISKKIPFDLVAGTSTGALIAPLVATGDIDLLEKIYSMAETDKIIKKNGGLNMVSVYTTEGLKSLIDSYIDERRYKKILESPTEVFLTTVNLANSQIKYWNPKTSGKSGKAMSIEDFKSALLASASMPILMPPVKIGKEYHVDGGVREVAPLSVAIDKDAETIYAIILSAETSKPKDIKLTGLMPIAEVALATIDALVQDVADNDIGVADLYNKSVVYFASLRERARQLLTPEQIKTLFNGEVENPFENKQLLKLYKIRPESELPAEALEFVPEKMKQMIKLGQERAKAVLKDGPLAPSPQTFEEILAEMRKEIAVA